MKTFRAKPFIIFVYTIQEWIQWNLWKTPFKKLESYNLSKWTMSLQIFERLSSTKFTWSILGYFVSFFSYFEKKKFKFMFKTVKLITIDFQLLYITKIFLSFHIFQNLGKCCNFTQHLLKANLEKSSKKANELLAKANKLCLIGELQFIVNALSEMTYFIGKYKQNS